MNDQLEIIEHEIEDEDIPVAEMYGLINHDSNVEEVEEDGKVVTTIGRQYGDPLTLHGIENFVKQAARSTVAPFQIARNSKGEMFARLQTPLAHEFKVLGAYKALYRPDFEYSPHVWLFFQGCKKFQLLEYPLLGRPGLPDSVRGKIEAEIFNDLVAWIKAEAATKAFKNKVYSRTYNAVRNYRETKFYIDRLFERHSRLLVCRIDLGYKK
jgi:hypothetical protein